MKRIGVLGGGQLGMMLFESIGDLPVRLSFLDPDPACSCAAIGADVVLGDFKDFDQVLAFGRNKDIVTVEIEHVNTAALKELQTSGVEVYPQPDILELIQDKGLQKEFYRENKLPTAPYSLIASKNEIDPARFPFPFVLKSRKGGYDGKGVALIRDEGQLDNALSGPLVIEHLADIQKELSVIVARDIHGEVSSFPVVEMEFDPEANLVSALISPAELEDDLAEEATSLAESLIRKLGLVGLLAVEMFLLKDGRIWINEVAPRPHNSGHQTIEGNSTSQYAQHLRAIAGLGLGPTEALGTAVMVNLLGADGHQGPRRILGREEVEHVNHAHLHDYHKAITRPKRKMGHITVVDSDRQNALELALDLQKKVSFVSDREMGD
ncbi:MAG: 5-(carboxyamino)imidazole ribonucleotide synthase [Flavobacteriales bacterium]|nr:5-(carboxyamino)imidazole ribonucleotide synthase [Flavobacteriales bacterium]